MTPRERLEFVIEAWESNRPTQWIARSLGQKPEEIAHVLRVAGLKPRNFRGTLARYDQMESLVLDGASQSEIVRTLGGDNRTVTKWFPQASWGTGGWARTGANLVRELNQELRRIDKHGNVSTRRGKS